MAVTARQQPDFRTISDVRKRHLLALSGLFTHVRQVCQQAGVVTWGHVALDRTKIRTAQTALEAEAAMRARTEPAPSDRPRRGCPAKHPPGTPLDRAPRHFTDPDRRIMKAWDRFIHGYTPKRPSMPRIR
jgi:hypothetical protein